MRVLYLSLGSLNGQDDQDGHHSHNGQGSQCGHGGQGGQGNDLGIWSILSLAVPILQFLNTVHKTVAPPPPFFTRPESNHCLLLSSTIMILDEEVEKVKISHQRFPVPDTAASTPPFLPPLLHKLVLPQSWAGTTQQERGGGREVKSVHFSVFTANRCTTGLLSKVNR